MKTEVINGNEWVFGQRFVHMDNLDTVPRDGFGGFIVTFYHDGMVYTHDASPEIDTTTGIAVFTFSRETALSKRPPNEFERLYFEKDQ